MAALGPIFTRMIVPAGAASVRDFIDEARTRLLEECDYGLEARRQQRFGDLYAGDPCLVIPRIHSEWCGPRVLVSTWEEGLGLDQFLARDPSAAERDRFGEALFRFYFGALYRHGIFHADPHPGNYAFREDGSLVIFDFGCVREFDRDTVQALARLLRAVRDDSEPAIRAAFADFGALPPDRDDDYARLRSLLRGFFGPLLVPGRHLMDARVRIDVNEVMRDKLAMARMRLPGKLLFLFRIRFGLYSVLSRIGSRCDWQALEDRHMLEAGLEP
jgi:predicted unusual protein kinase regulating ubiquinone biosynthesis (AarF/ABC1/UbiB family)